MASDSQKLMDHFEGDPPGLTDKVKSYVDDAQNPLHDQLAPGEQVVAEFDVYYPERRLPRWKVVLLSVCTCGVFLVLYGLYRLYREIMFACYRNGCCTPRFVNFERGKMAVTNQGRAICWKQIATQLKHRRPFFLCCFKLCCPQLCAPSASFHVHSQFQHFALKDVQEVTQVFDTSFGRWWWGLLCCCCAPSDAAVCLTFGGWDGQTPFGAASTVQVVQKHTFVQQTSMFLASLGQNMITSAFGVTATTYPKVYIVSGKRDVLHKGDPADKFRALQHLTRSITQLLPRRADRFLNSGTAPTNFSLAQRVDDVQIVDDEGVVSIHPSLLNLLEGEETVLEAFGGIYVISLLDWILTVLTAGLYYLFVVRVRRYLRTALVLTNKRVIEVGIFHPRGLIPSHYAGVCFTARSFFPLEDGSGGMIRRARRFGATIAMFGELGLAMEFNGADFKSERIVDKFIAFSHALSKTTSRQEPLMVAGHHANQTVQEPLVPVMQGEALLSYINEEPQWRPCCFLPCSGSFLCEPSCDPWYFPGMVLLLTCGFRPFKTTPEIFITDHTAFALQVSRSVTQGCCAGQRYVLAYAPVRRLIGTHYEVQTNGTDTFLTRLFAGTALGNLFCPVAYAVSNFKVHTSDVALSIFRIARGDVNLRADSRLPAARDQISEIINAIEAEHRAPELAVAKEV